MESAQLPCGPSTTVKISMNAKVRCRSEATSFSDVRKEDQVVGVEIRDVHEYSGWRCIVPIMKTPYSITSIYCHVLDQ
jgi:hypothetical protein